jgi:DNA invertase Pin-like site-specific DNA recombinase
VRIGYSYLRYSSPQQGDGDSVRRQTEAAADWCKRHPDVRLDTHRTYLDRGRSAYHGRHRQRGGALKEFLAEVERGDIPKGSVLVVENLDRLSRENPYDSIPLLCSLVNAGIAVVSLFPREMVFERGGDDMSLTIAAADLGQSHSASAKLAARMDEVWGAKRRAVRDSGAILTRMLPGWVEERDGRLMLIPERARVVRRMFGLVIGGYGLSLIARELARDGVPTWGEGGKRRSKGWTKSYIHKILTSRAAIGEYQPMSHGRPDGGPIPDYYPAAVDEGTWLQVQDALRRRKHQGGRIGEKVATLFGGLLRDATTGDRLLVGQ